MVKVKEKILNILEELKLINVREYYQNLAKKANPQMLPNCSKYFAKKEEIDINKIKIEIEFVETQKQANVFRSAMSFWSVPISAGYGRRIRIIIWDRTHYKVFGIIGLCDPVIALGVRDNYIGWNKEEKQNRLYNMLTAYVLGAIPPYNQLLGAKLVALLAGSKEVSDYFKSKYKEKETIIRQRKPISELVAIDTMGAFGQSAIYHKLKEWKFLGYTKGTTHLHLTSNGFWEIAYKYAEEKQLKSIKQYEFGKGSNWKFRVLREIFQNLKINTNILHIRHQRGYYFRPLIENWKDFLTGKTDKVIRKNKTLEEYFEFWKEKFFYKGIKRWFLSSFQVAETPSVREGRSNPYLLSFKNVFAFSRSFNSLYFADAHTLVPSNFLKSKYPVVLLPDIKHSIPLHNTF